jgi:hypothetical protein
LRFGSNVALFRRYEVLGRFGRGQQQVISIGRYLNGQRRNPGTEPSVHFSGDLCGFSSAILECINQFVLTGDVNETLRAELLQVKDALRPDLKPDELSMAAESVSSVLAAHHESSKRTASDQALEAQHIFAVLNQALVVLAEGNDQSLSRLATIQESLHRSSTLRDITSLKASLAETVQFIKTESAHAREHSAAELGRFETEVTKAREFLGSTRLELAGRPEGVLKISHSLKQVPSGEALYLLAYLCDRLTAVTQRYGPGVTDELVSRLIKERVKPLVPENTTYRWTASSLVAVFTCPRDADKVRRDVSVLNRTPLVHKLALGGRTAVLTLAPSHLVVESVSDSPASLIEQVDKFTRAVA